MERLHIPAWWREPFATKGMTSQSSQASRPTPKGKVFPEYTLRPWLRENLDGMRVLRGAIYPSHDSRARHRAANYLSFAFSGSALAMSALRDVDVLYVYSSPATAALPAMALKALAGIPYVLHIQDLWPQTVLSSGLIEGESGRVERGLHRFCDAAYRHAHTVAVTSPGMADLVSDRGVPPSKVTWIPNWADEGSFYPTSPSAATLSALGPLRAFTAMYAGNFGELQSLETVIEAAEHLRDRPDIGFVLVGAGVAESRLRSMVDTLALDNVRFVPPQPFTHMAEVLSAGDTQLVSLRDEPLFASTLPSKLQANLASGRPVVGAVRGDAARVIRDSAAGDAVAPGDAKGLAGAVARLAELSPSDRQALGCKARTYYEASFSERVLVEQLSQALRRLLKRGGRNDVPIPASWCSARAALSEARWLKRSRILAPPSSAGQRHASDGSLRRRRGKPQFVSQTWSPKPLLRFQPGRPSSMPPGSGTRHTRTKRRSWRPTAGLPPFSPLQRRHAARASYTSAARRSKAGATWMRATTTRRSPRTLSPRWLGRWRYEQRIRMPWCTGHLVCMARTAT